MPFDEGRKTFLTKDHY